MSEPERGPVAIIRRVDAPPVGPELDAYNEWREAAKALVTAQEALNAANARYRETLVKLSEIATTKP